MTLDSALARLEPLAYALMRVITGALFALHGSQKLLGWPPGMSAPTFPSQMWVGGVIELVTGTLIAVGLFARPAAFLASGTMAVAYVQFHWKLGAASWLPMINKGEPALLLCLAFFLIAARGAGAASIDRLRS